MLLAGGPLLAVALFCITLVEFLLLLVGALPFGVGLVDVTLSELLLFLRGLLYSLVALLMSP